MKSYGSNEEQRVAKDGVFGWASLYGFQSASCWKKKEEKKSAPAAHPDGDEGGKDGDHDNWEDLESSPPNQPSTKHD